jgi:O-methyltransferase involved in polyketide biosynthesis
MKSFSLFIIFIFIFVTAISAQTEKLVLEENVPNISTAKNDKVMISVEDWNTLEAALQIENWNKTLSLSEEYLQKIGAETKDGKKARLRYIYLYALAGKVLSYSSSGDREQEEIARTRLEIAAKSYVGREFIFPVRKILANCKGALNYVCESQENPGFLHVAATNSAGTSIYFSEYVELPSVILDVRKLDKADVVLGGTLKGVRLNREKSDKLVMTLQFEKGFVKNLYTY